MSKEPLRQLARDFFNVIQKHFVGNQDTFEDEIHDILPQSMDMYIKWFTGETDKVTRDAWILALLATLGNELYTRDEFIDMMLSGKKPDKKKLILWYQHKKERAKQGNIIELRDWKSKRS
ncbi:hypothetical protein ACFO25_09325 [Paenactinomyces guangxiensis]|uniref:Uncharacterized protein n=1 Tax=Paenactinomyces guangxiensis TaxID=1490290 RepID=A0A7W2A739_9BACL|nr:hypothetical protein [Paenactinomyces guangxiensis]MBA4492754.1 hypothetical protein [Paenactinomyces guangxiensis]MBH8590397.1 hypothetical protein [Paenactinomyces guangxiensis]